MTNTTPPNMIGAYGPWAASIIGDALPRLSFRRDDWTDIDSWRTAARQRALDCLMVPDTGAEPTVTVKASYVYDGLHVEELTWQLPYGPPTEGVFLKPAAATGPLPGVLALHDHGGQKYFGKRKISQTGDAVHAYIRETHWPTYYGDRPWANALAKQGYAVLVPDAFGFASRRVLRQDVPEAIAGRSANGELLDETTETPEAIAAYNAWAANHESILAKSLFCAGTTWPGVFLAEDQRALDVLCARDDVDAERIGIGGLSGGGLRTVYLGGIDPRVKAAVCVGMMTTWRDYLLHKSHTHTWMIYIPQLPHDLDYPEVLGLRAPLPTMALNNIDDPLFTLPEMERADTILRTVYEKAGAGDHYVGAFYPGPHKFDLAMQSDAFKFFDRWLNEA